MQKFTLIFTFLGLILAYLANAAVVFATPVNEVAKYRDLVVALREDIRDTRIADQLDVNIRRNVRMIFPNKCEREGEFELHRLAARASVEESYILIAALCLWIEVGYDENQDTVRLDSKFVSAVLAQYSSLIFYHIQPGNMPGIENYFPSYKDLLTLVLINADTVQKLDVRIRHRLITTLGIIEYEFSNRNQVSSLMKKFKEFGLEGYEAQNLAYEYMRPKYRNDYYEKVKNCEVYEGTIRQKIISCSPIKTEAFTLKFKPLH